MTNEEIDAPNGARSVLRASEVHLINIQEKQIEAELKAIYKHGKNGKARSVIFAARTRAVKAIMDLGFTFQQAREAVTDAADMVILHLEAAK